MVENYCTLGKFNLGLPFNSALRASVNRRPKLNFTSGTIIFHHSPHEQSIFVYYTLILLFKSWKFGRWGTLLKHSNTVTEMISELRGNIESKACKSIIVTCTHYLECKLEIFSMNTWLIVIIIMYGCCCVDLSTPVSLACHILSISLCCTSVLSDVEIVQKI